MPDRFTIEREFILNNEALWGVSKALKLAPKYRAKIWDVLSPEDQEILRNYSLHLKAAEPQTSLSKGGVKGKP